MIDRSIHHANPHTHTPINPCIHTPPSNPPQIIQQVLLESGHDPAIAALVCGVGPEVGEKLVADPRMELVSFTGSTKVRRNLKGGFVGSWAAVFVPFASWLPLTIYQPKHAHTPLPKTN